MEQVLQEEPKAPLPAAAEHWDHSVTFPNFLCCSSLSPFLTCLCHLPLGRTDLAVDVVVDLGSLQVVPAIGIVMLWDSLVYSTHWHSCSDCQLERMRDPRWSSNVSHNGHRIELTLLLPSCKPCTSRTPCSPPWLGKLDQSWQENDDPRSDDLVDGG